MPTLLRLASVDETGLPVRRRLALSVFTADERAIVDAFVDARLLTTTTGNGAGAPGGDGDGPATVEVAHEALLRQWPPAPASDRELPGVAAPTRGDRS